MESETLLIHPIVYVLELEDNCWYVGYTHNLNSRISQHMSGNGSRWTQLHKYKKIKKVVYPGSKLIERELTLKYMKKYGWENVRGAGWCVCEMKSCPKEVLNNELNHIE